MCAAGSWPWTTRTRSTTTRSSRAPAASAGWPHSVETLTTEYRSFIFNSWGSYYWDVPEGVDDPWVKQNHGWVGDFAFNWEAADIDPRESDGLYVGPSRGHTDPGHAEQIGMPRRYGYGASMGAWTNDYVAYWAGHEGMVRHANIQFREPAFEHDVTYLNAEVMETHAQDPELGVPIAKLMVNMTNQDDAVLARGEVAVELLP